MSRALAAYERRQTIIGLLSDDPSVILRETARALSRRASLVERERGSINGLEITARVDADMARADKRARRWHARQARIAVRA